MLLLFFAIGIPTQRHCDAIKNQLRFSRAPQDTQIRSEHLRDSDQIPIGYTNNQIWTDGVNVTSKLLSNNYETKFL